MARKEKNQNKDIVVVLITKDGKTEVPFERLHAERLLAHPNTSWMLPLPEEEQTPE